MSKNRAKPGRPSTPTKDSRKGFVLGCSAFAKISEVEGIRLSAEAKDRAKEGDRKGFSTEQRRQSLIKAFSANR